MTLSPKDYLSAARVPHTLEPQTFGFWTVHRLQVDELSGVERGLNPEAVGGSDYTLLRCISMSSLHLEAQGGEIVMEDSLRELRKHLPIWMAAKGRVLVTGLGLGCVVRGLLAKPEVEHVDVVEIDKDIVRVVGEEFADEARVTIHLGDALELDIPEVEWDYAWHDIWCDGNLGLNKLHLSLLARFRKRVRVAQGAWALPRPIKRVRRAHLRQELLG